MPKADNNLKPTSNLSPAKQALLEQRLRGVSQQQATRQTIKPRPDSKVAPLSFAQERFWFFSRYQPDIPAYNRPMALRLAGLPNVPALQHTLTEIVRRHEVLRAFFVEQNGQPVQMVAPAQLLLLPIVDLTIYPEVERETRVLLSITQETLRLFDLTQSPLIRATLFRLSQTEHILLLVIHHIVFDSWSAQIFKRDLIEIYQSYVANLPVSLPPLPIQYADFAGWQRRQLQSKKLDVLFDYWLKKLAAAPSSLNLPTDYPRPAAVTHNGAHYKFLLPVPLLNQIKTLGRQEDVTLFMVLLATFFILLHRYSGQSDIVLGSPIAGRPVPETENLVGHFLNTLALRANLSGNPTFQNFLSQIKEITLEAYEHQDLPFEKLIEALKPHRDLSRAPLFQVFINLENFSQQLAQPQGLNISDFEFDSQTTQFDLTLEMIEQEAGLACSLGYNTDLFNRQTIERLAGHFQSLLAGIVANPNEYIGYLPLLAAPEQHLLAEWNNTQIDYPKDLAIHQLFEIQAKQAPTAIAVEFEQERLTYGELNARANQLAHFLRKRGVGPEVLVGICIERSPEMIVGMLATLKAGGAYVPLDPSYPQERLAYLVKDIQTPVLLTQQKWLAKLSQTQADIICLDNAWHLIGDEGSDNLIHQTQPQNLAYVIYTSGSTGQPKGVQIEHQSLLNLLYWHQTVFNVSAQDRATQVAGLSFDASVWEIWPYLACGASLSLLLDIENLSPAQVRDWLVTRNITITFLPTPIAESILKLDWPADAALRVLLTGGDRLSTYPAGYLPFKFINNYGPTESTVVTTSAVILPNPQTQPLLPAIGLPVFNTQVYILDKHLQLNPVGVPGELYIGGAGLARGYLNQPQLTAEKFIPHPFNNAPGERLYKTGDLARYLPDGNIEFLGRMDNQVKLRGFRIELGEIETILHQFPTVQQVVVTDYKDNSDNKRLAAYIVPKAKECPTTSELRAFLKQKLPDYMIPAAFIILDALPLTPHGKIDRAALPSPDSARPNLTQTFIPPENDVEKVLAGIWGEVLGLPRLGLFDNFFELGGHSLLATQIMSRINTLFTVDIPLRALFEMPTIAELSHLLLEPADSRLQIEQTAQVLLELSKLSDEEIKVMLNDESASLKNQST